jgi:hypothetical protein
MSDIRDIKPLGPAWPVTPADEDKQQRRNKPRPGRDRKQNSTDQGPANDDSSGQIDEYA